MLRDVRARLAVLQEGVDVLDSQILACAPLYKLRDNSRPVYFAHTFTPVNIASVFCSNALPSPVAVSASVFAHIG